MTANELRHNSCYLLNGKIERFNILSHVQWDLKCYEGIPLTPELLMDCGFIAHAIGYYHLGEFYISYSNSGLHEYQFRDYPVRFKYLHQLQNLYFALTGEELEEQEIVNHFISSVKEWVNQGQTSTYVFFCEPEIVPKVKEALSEYIVQVSYVAYVGWVQAQISVQRKIDSDFTEIKITDDTIFGRLK